MLTDDVPALGWLFMDIGGALLVVFYAVPAVWLYVLVRRNTHPTRSTFLSFAAALALIVGAMVLFVVATLFVMEMAGYGPMHPAQHDPAGQALLGIGIGGVFGSAVFGWRYIKSRISRPRHA
jgi:hypothetical protein